MDQKKIEALFRSAQGVLPPSAAGGFTARLMRQVRGAAQVEPLGWTEQLLAFWPRLAAGAVAVILLCATAEIWTAMTAAQDFESGVTAISEQWLFAAEGGN